MNKVVLILSLMLLSAGALADDVSVLDFSQLQSKQAQLQADLAIKKLQAAIAKQDLLLKNPQGNFNKSVHPVLNGSSNGENVQISNQEPVLQALMGSNGHYQARVSMNGQSMTVGMGDRLGKWCVVSIGAEGVSLKSADGKCSAHLDAIFTQSCQGLSR